MLKADKANFHTAGFSEVLVNRTKRAALICGLVLMAGCLTAQTAHASMIGDTLVSNRLFPDLLTPYCGPPCVGASVSTVVQAGMADVFANQLLYLINPEANSILIDFTASSGFGGTATIFDGFEFLGFSNTIQNVAYTASGVTVVFADFGSNYIHLNLNGQFDANSFVNLDITFAPTTVPEPNTLMLMLFGALWLFAIRRRFA